MHPASFLFASGPQCFQLGRRQVLKRPLRSQLHLPESLAKTQIATAQSHLRVHAQVPAEIHHRKEQIAELRFNSGLRGSDRLAAAASASSSAVSSASLGSKSRQWASRSRPFALSRPASQLRPGRA